MPVSSTLVNKIKVQLKLSISRLRMVQQKDSAIAKQQRRAMAQLLEQGKEESARIRVENIIRSDITTELLEVLELYCELLLARAGLLETATCDPGLEEAIVSLIYAAPRLEVKELSIVRGLFGEKYGKDFVLAADGDVNSKVAARVKDKLRVEPPARELVDAYLSTIADAYDIDWPPGAKEEAARRAAGGDAEGMDLDGGADGDGDNHNDEDNPADGDKIEGSKDQKAQDESEELSKATPPRDVGRPMPVKVMPRSPTSEDVRPGINLPSAGTGLNKTNEKIQKHHAASKSTPGPGGKIPDVDELAKRFAQLKR